MVTIAIVDQSFPMDSNHNNDELGAMNVNIFRKNCEDFPKCRRAGDVIRLQEAGIQVSWFLLIVRERLRFFLKKSPQDYREKVQLLGRTTTKIDVFSCDHSGTTPTFLLNGNEVELQLDELQRFRDLWDWGQKRIATQVISKPLNSFKLSETASIEEAGDCTAMICGIFETSLLSNSQMPKGFLRIWDGTGAPRSDPLPEKSPTALAGIEHGDPPSEALVALHSTVELLNTSPYKRETAKFLSDILSVCGRVVNVAVWETPHWDFVKSNFKIGDFIRFRNVLKGTLDNGITCT